MRCAGKMKHLLWCFMFVVLYVYRNVGFWGGIATDTRSRAKFVWFIGMFFLGLRWGSVCEAMLVYCDDVFNLRRLFKSFRTQVYLTRWNGF